MKDALKKPSRACWMEFLWGHPSCSGPPMVSLRSSFSGFIVKISRSGGEVPASRSRMSTLSRQWQDWYLSHISLAWKSLLCALGRLRFHLMIKSCPVVTLWSNHGQLSIGMWFWVCCYPHTSKIFIFVHMNVSATVCIICSRFDYCMETTMTPPLWGHCLSKVEKGEDDR